MLQVKREHIRIEHVPIAILVHQTPLFRAMPEYCNPNSCCSAATPARCWLSVSRARIVSRAQLAGPAWSAPVQLDGLYSAYAGQPGRAKAQTEAREEHQAGHENPEDRKALARVVEGFLSHGHEGVLSRFVGRFSCREVGYSILAGDRVHAIAQMRYFRASVDQAAGAVGL